ncbi:hypothetical protein KBB96_19535 [Luteolibacter ambystomatis]|uniref:Uncharacterized protein n=1 Tax=Luteolibacter ambystomatis TaxID=2824561 RepID=A0A975G979_9BACT|nr:hypothetical protein [Luteolibacter ambystomatis]QUE51035.1 hypothetical protein KBB96_19535 [Luteolibacter ambystomatis]
MDRHLKSTRAGAKRIGRLWWIAALCLLPLASGCGKREVTRKSKVQEKEIQRLQTELDGLDAELKLLPKDRTKEVEESRKRLEDLEKAAARLNPEIEQLETAKAAREKESISYRAQYPLKSH